MDSRFTFDDIRSSRPQSISTASRIAKLKGSIAELQDRREFFVTRKPSEVAKLSDQIAKKERLLQQLDLGPAGPRRKKP
jgi:hypothetical protein